MKKLIIFFSFLFSQNIFAQNVAVNADGTAPETGVMLDVKAPAANAKVNTVAAQTFFQIRSSDAATDALKLRLGFKTDAAQANRYGFIDLADLTAGTPTYLPLNLQPSGGRVGIGTTNPAAKLANTSVNTLDIPGNGISTSSMAWLINAQGYVTSLVNTDATASGRNGLLIKTSATDVNSFPLQINVGGTNIITARGDGNVGIGTTTPITRLANTSVNTLDVTGTAGLSSNSIGWLTNSAGFVASLVNTDATANGRNGLLIKTAATDANSYPLQVNVGATSVIAARGNGNVGIGTSSPGTKLEVVGGNGTTMKIVDGNQAAGKVLTSDANGVASWANPAAGTMVLLHNDEVSVSGTAYVNTTAFTYNVAGTFSQVKVEADIENDCSGGADISLQGWLYKIVYNGVTKRTAQLLCGDKSSNDDWLSGHFTYMGAVANGQTVKIDVVNSGTAGTWYVRNFRVWGIY